MKPRLTATSVVRQARRLAKTAIHFLVKNSRKYGHSVNKANFFWPIGDRINGVPLYMFSVNEFLFFFKEHYDAANV